MPDSPGTSRDGLPRPLWLISLVVTACSAHGSPDVIFLPSAVDVVERMLELARVQPQDVVYDLGCGDGRIVIAAVRARAARGVCIDIDPSRIAASRRNADTAGVRQRIEFRQADLFETDLRTATVVALYLSPALNERLRPKLFREVGPGARIVSHNFAMGDWRPDTLVRVAWPAGTTSTIYAWVLPADVAGTWELTAPVVGNRRLRIRLAQHYQKVSGTASLDGRPLAFSGERLVGNSIEFRLRDERARGSATLRFTGRVSGATMTGALQVGADSGGPWQAVRP